MVSWYRMHDVDNRGAIEIPAGLEAEAQRWNRQGYGIFWTVNDFNGPRRIENLTRINAWAVDMDEGTKEEQLARIRQGKLAPSRIVETKRGYQVYWFARDAKAEHWNAIVLDRLVPFFGADKNARDLARILRVPGYLHQKDPANPFRVVERPMRGVNSPPVYSEWLMAQSFPDVGGRERAKAAEEVSRKEVRDCFNGKAHTSGDDFWQRVYNLDCRVGLERLSGHSAVRGERYTFKDTRSGTKNIIVDGKGTSCWVDRSGRIGSLSKGGPTLFNWLRWMGCTPREAVDVLKQTFPELERK